MTRSEVEDRASFEIIRYAQVWEDADVLLEALDVREGEICLSIASAGDNALALLTRNPRRVIALDLSQAQLYCLELRMAAYRTLAHDELLELVGSRPSKRRGALLARCRAASSPACADFWQARRAEVEDHGIGGVGKFERYFRLFRRFVLPLAHSGAEVDALLAPKEREARARFYDKTWNSWRWRGLLSLFFSRPVMGRLGRDPAFFRYAEGGMAAQVARRVAHALVELEPDRNPYLHWILKGRHGSALPFALRPENFAAIRDNLDRLDIRKQSLEDYLAEGEGIDAFNLSDIFEYMSEAAFERLYHRIVARANPGARIAYWNMLVPRSRPPALAERVLTAPEFSQDLHGRDKAFFYSRFHLERVP
jgi:S-adenosylmethionine-diacylglycerol 3-amino-3-carboxypropyl transferase